MTDVQDTPPPVRDARQTIAEYEGRRGSSRHDTPIRLTEKTKNRRLIFDMPIAFHVTIWLFVGGLLVTATTKANAWLGARDSKDEYFESALQALAKRQDATDAAIKELAQPIRDLSVQVSRLGGIIDTRNRLNSTVRGAGGAIGE